MPESTAINWCTLPKVSHSSSNSAGSRNSPSSSSQRRFKKPRTASTDSDAASVGHLQSLFGKNLSHHDARLRALEGDVDDAVALPTDDEIVIDMLAAGVDYHAATQQPGHRAGNKPWVYAWSYMVRRLLQQDDLPTPLRAALEAHVAQYGSPKKLARVVRRCAVKTQRNQKKATIIVHVRSKLEPLWEQILGYLELHGCEQVEINDEPAPRGPLIRSMLEQMSALKL
eukprot:TRINITY_DN19846_c0_g1_i1.p1 TRINITY_DN19846_c0_g1~~TRINITY_DN19846_c0_g1_i1.p1  ORF type:complete len:227 (-),score=26.31 TRINITY_DN19846_c0_g1_i1:284-964(-)